MLKIEFETKSKVKKSTTIFPIDFAKIFSPIEI